MERRTQRGAPSTMRVLSVVAQRQQDPPVSEAAQAGEWACCAASPLYFLQAYGWVFNATREAWLPFDLCPAQAWLLVQLRRQRLLVMLKARQLGMTWLLLGYGLWQMLFHPATTVGIFSRTEEDAVELLDFRLKGMYAHLPAFLRCRAVVGDNKSRWELSNGSVAMAFPTTGDGSIPSPSCWWMRPTISRTWPG